MNYEEVSTLKLANRLNEIMVEENRLAIEYNEIVSELKIRFPNLKDDRNLEKKKVRVKR